MRKSVKKVLIGTNTDILDKYYGTAGAVAMIAEAGFDCVDLAQFNILSSESEFYGSGYADVAREVRAAAEAAGIPFTQSHAPFPSYIDGNGDYNKSIYNAICKSIEIAGIVGAERIVVHPITLRGEPERQFETNMAFFRSVENTARQNGVKIALENMFAVKDGAYVSAACSEPDEFNRYLDALPADIFTACLDIGHTRLVGPGAETMIASLGKRLTCLHVHDNFGNSDLHTVPYQGNTDWRSVMSALGSIGYSGEHMLEIYYFLVRTPPELLAVSLKYISQITRAVSALDTGSL